MVIEKIQELLNAGAKKAGYEEEFSVSFSNMPGLCDFQCNGCFSLAKKYEKAPFVIAEEIVNEIEESDEFEFSVVKPAFINIKLTDKILEKTANKYLTDKRGGLKKHEEKQKVILDYGGANVAKALHVGHLRPAIIGESLKRLYKLMGDEVISDVHLGDWGLQMGLTELQLFQDGHLDGFLNPGNKGGKITIELLNEAYPKANIRKKEDEEFKHNAEEWTVKIQNKEEPYYTIYKAMREVSVKEIKENYHKLGAEFDLWYGESDASEYTDEVIQIFKDKNLAHESEGALVVDVAVEGENVPLPKKSDDEVQRYSNPMPPCIIQKSNGAVLYATTDIATIYMRNKMFKNVDRIEYVTDARQQMHFTQVFRASKLAEISPENQQLVHVGHGTMNGYDGKPFKTRSGDTLKLEDIISLLIEKAGEKLKSNNVDYDESLALKIGVGAMKFGDLINNVGKDYVFDLDKFVSFEGKTGPYLQYTVCRINSILNKANKEGGKIKMYSDDERNIIKTILKLNSSYELCYKEKSLNGLCLAVYDLASAFSTFYNNHNILNEKDEEKQASYIALLSLVKAKMLQALDVLAIEVPEKM
ncbi:MAG: arginine--tRNA ligase [Clostridia bacterium]|nr:arginine--tRNA ligase [Clostridia bacterium]